MFQRSTLLDHSTRPATLEAIAAHDDFTHVFLQPRVFELTTSHPDADRAAGIAAAVTLAEAVWASSPNAVVVLVTPPACASNDSFGAGAFFASPEAMHAEIMEGCELALDAIQEANPGKRAVLDRWAMALWAHGSFLPTTNPDHLDPWRGDNYHPNDDSITIDIVSRFSFIYQVDPSAVVEDWIADQAAPVSGAFPLAPTDVVGLSEYAYRFGRFGTYPPIFTTQPADTSAVDGAASFGPVAVRANPVATLQWRVGGVDIEGETGNTLDLTGLDGDNDGEIYTCAATNAVDEHESAAAELSVVTFQNFKVDLSYFPSIGLEGHTVLDMPTAIGADVDGIWWPVINTLNATSPYEVQLVAPAHSGIGANNNGVVGTPGYPGNLAPTHWICTTVPGQIKFRGLPQIPLRVTGRAWRSNDGINRNVDVSVIGATTQNYSFNGGSVDPAMPAGVVVTPDANGELIFQWGLGTGNTTFGHISLIEVSLEP